MAADKSRGGHGGLNAGSTSIWLCVLGPGLNLDSFTMTPTEGPYGGVAATVPGLIEAEEFDYGGEGVAYTETTEDNIRGEFRPDEGVDIEALENGGYNIGLIATGESLRYTVDVPADVDGFDFSFRVSSFTGLGSLRVVTGGAGCDNYSTDLSGLVSVPDTGGWYDYGDVTISRGGNGGLETGTSFIWLCVVHVGVNVDSFTLAITEGPYGGFAATVPGLIEAEEFDYGGAGVAYSDTTSENEGGDFRTDEAVDIEDLDAGYIVGWMEIDEYLRYTVDVTEDVRGFDVSFRVSSTTGWGSLHVVTGGSGCDDYSTDLSGIVSVPNTGSFDDYQDVTISGGGNGGLESGSTSIWLCVVKAGLNLDSFTMTASPVLPIPSPTKAPTSAPNSPSTGTPTIAPTTAPASAPTTAPSPASAPTTDPTTAPVAAPTPLPTTSPTRAESSEAYGGFPSSIPGTIEAEEFDYGGEGMAYSDTNVANIGGAFRLDEAVDIKAYDGGYKVGIIKDGEYLRYSVVVTEDVASFYFSFFVAAKRGAGSFRIVAGGTGCDNYTTDLSGTVLVPDTGGWNSFKHHQVSGEGTGGLDAGPAYIWFCALSSGFTIDYFIMAAAEIASSPYGGTLAVVPGVIEAEEFDTGGRGLAYSDTNTANKGGEFRTDESVDIGSTADGYYVGWNKLEEYLHYTVDVSTHVAAFDFTFVVAGPNRDSGSFRIVTGGTGCEDYTTDLSGLVSAPSDGGSNFSEVTTLAAGNGGMSAGTAIIRMCVVDKRFNLDSFTMAEH